MKQATAIMLLLLLILLLISCGRSNNDYNAASYDENDDAITSTYTLPEQEPELEPIGGTDIEVETASPPINILSPPLNRLDWIIEPRWEFGRIRVCCTFPYPWDDIPWDELDFSMSYVGGYVVDSGFEWFTYQSDSGDINIIFCMGHGLAWYDYFVDEESGMFIDVFMHYGGNAFDRRTPERIDYLSLAGFYHPLRAIRRIDGEKFEELVASGSFIYEGPGEAVIEMFALAYGSQILTDFIFTNGSVRAGGESTSALAVMQLDGKWGMLDENAKTVLPFIFDDIEFIDSHTIFAKYNGLYGIMYIGRQHGFRLTESINWRIEPSLDILWFDNFSEGLAVVHTLDGTGVVDIDGNFVIPPTFRGIHRFEHGLAVAFNNEQRAGVINGEGVAVIPFEFLHLQSSSHGWGFVGSKLVGDIARYGAIDTQGNIIVPFEFDWVQYLGSGMFGVVKGYKYGHIRWGTGVDVALIYDVCLGFFQHGPPFQRFSEGLAGVAVQAGDDSQSRVYGFIDWRGDVAIPLQFQWVEPFNQGLATAWLDSNAGVIDREGNIIVPFIYNRIGPFSEGFAAVGIGDWGSRYYGFINRDGEMVIPPQRLNRLEAFSEGLAAFELPNGRGGFMNRQGEVVIPAEYGLILDWVYRGDDLISKFDRGLAVVATHNNPDDSLRGIIDENGNIILPLEFTWVGDFNNGLARVSTGHNWYGGNYRVGFVNRAGEFVLPVEFEDATDFSEGVAAVKQDGLWGIIEVARR